MTESFNLITKEDELDETTSQLLNEDGDSRILVRLLLEIATVWLTILSSISNTSLIAFLFKDNEALLAAIVNSAIFSSDNGIFTWDAVTIHAVIT